jgi:hypothetical protein
MINHVTTVDQTGRLFREGKASNAAELPDVCERPGCSAQGWIKRMEKLRKCPSLGPFLAATRAKLRELAELPAVRHLFNLASCPAQ